MWMLLKPRRQRTISGGFRFRGFALNFVIYFYIFRLLQQKFIYFYGEFEPLKTPNSPIVTLVAFVCSSAGTLGVIV